MTSSTPIRRWTLIAALALVTLFVTLPVLAQHRRHHPAGPMDEGARHARMIERLGLSDEQQEKVQAVLDEQKGQMKAGHEQLRDARMALRDKIHAEEFDEAGIREAAARVASAEADMAVARAAAAQQMRRILTPEQQEKARKMRERHLHGDSSRRQRLEDF